MLTVLIRTRSCRVPLLLSLLALSATVTSALPRQLHSVVPCVLTHTTYQPSALEAEWTANVAEWGNPKTPAVFCTHVTPHTADVTSWLGTVGALMKSPFAALRAASTNASAHAAAARHRASASPTKKSWFSRRTAADLSGAAADGDPALLSFFTHHYQCGDQNHTQRSPIEPLFGGLRHPLHGCSDADVLDKSYLLLQTAFGPPVSMEHAPKAWIFDLGASTYTEGGTGGAGASQQWFVERYKERGFTLDGYYGWEVTLHTPKEVLSVVPPDLLPHYVYYNVPAETGLKDLANPLNIMKAVAKVGDFVVLKLDIDNAAVELEFVRQILADPSVAALIDEFFFEHHVNFEHMNKYWATHKDPQTLLDSYAIYSKMRHMGIRAHGWV